MDESVLNSFNADYINSLYNKYKEDPNSIASEWQQFFDQYQDNQFLTQAPSWQKKIIGLEIDCEEFSNQEKAPKQKNKADKSDNNINLTYKVNKLIDNYRKNGHIYAHINSLADNNHHKINHQDYNIDDADLNNIIKFDDAIFNNKKVSEIITILQETYCRSSAIQIEHITNQEELLWLRQNLENIEANQPNIQEQKDSFKVICRTHMLEQFLNSRFPAVKVFGIGGVDTFNVAINTIINTLSSHQVKELIIGMAHRGRLNLLYNVLGRPLSDLFCSLKENLKLNNNHSGDVKYHVGYTGTKTVNNKQFGVCLLDNPSHLEAVNTVALGLTRAKQEASTNNSVVPLLVHGDAAFAGQGIVYETLCLNNIKDYDCGGTIHIIINNQIGFTALPSEYKSTQYCSDIAKGFDIPIIHVNCDDVNAVIRATKIATNYRTKFHKDVIISLIGYRVKGHNEADEPSYTQPLMYKKIKNKQPIADIYKQQLLNKNIVTTEKAENIQNEYKDILNEALQKSQNNYKPSYYNSFHLQQIELQNKDHNYTTATTKEQIQFIIDKSTTIPNSFDTNKKILRQLQKRKEDIKQGIDWATAETLAMATLLIENSHIRFSGQDSQRGTFSHRHFVLADQTNENKIIPINSIADKQASIKIINSPLSEYGVMGYEFGYSINNNNALAFWEGQFGDFANGAQIIIDQFLASSEVKWGLISNLVLLLPHGMEGQGPEHSSARPERYLQLCSNDNMRVCNITSPANYFHALRRQVHNKQKKPLIIMSPKSLLRSKDAVDNINKFIDKTEFLPLIPEEKKISNPQKVILCSGKIYYELRNMRDEINSNVVIIRLEQLYPWPEAQIAKELKKYKNCNYYWCQEEQQNNGYWDFVAARLNSILKQNNINKTIEYIGRNPCASPATGFMGVHKQEQEAIIKQAVTTKQ